TRCWRRAARRGSRRERSAAMKLARVRAGELLALAGAVCVLVALFERNYEGASGALDGWDTFGAGVVLLLRAAVAAIALAAAPLFERSVALPVALETATVLLALAALIAAIVRVLVRPDGATEV